MNEIGRNNEEQLALLAQRASQDGDDWRVKIARAASPGGRMEIVATFDAVTVEMIASADTWIPALMGGTGSTGVYYLYPTHVKDRATGRTSAMLTLPGLAGNMIPTDQIQWAKIEALGWPGPRILVYPKPSDLEAAPAGTVSTSPVSPAAGGGRLPLPPAGSPEALLAQIHEGQRKLDEARQKADLDALRRAQEEANRRNEAHLAEMRDLVKTIVSRPTATPNFAEMLTAILPLVQPILASRQAAEAERLRFDAAKAEREEARRAEDRKREEERAAEAQKRQDILMERVANQGAETSKVMASMAEASATMTRTMLQTVTSMMDMGIGRREEDSGWTEIGKALASAFGERMAMLMSQPAPPALPPKVGATSGLGTPPTTTPAAPAASGNEVSLFEAIIGRIAERDPDTNGLADSIINAIQTDAETQAALTAAGGNPIVMFQTALGEEWANDQENSTYAQALLTVLGEKAKAAGLMK